MKIFISWSGEESHAVAKVLHEELPCVIQALQPFVSSEDINKGTLWFQNIATELENSDFGIICLTKENQDRKWVLFEAGALAGRFSKTRVAPLLIDMTEPTVTQPFAQFQLTTLKNKEDFFKLLKSINSAMKEAALSPEILTRSFENWWKSFATKVNEAISNAPKSPKKHQERTEREILEEILSLVRSSSTQNGASSPLGITPGAWEVSLLNRLVAFGQVPLSGVSATPGLIGRPGSVAIGHEVVEPLPS